MQCQLYGFGYILNLSTSAQTHPKWRSLMRHSKCCSIAKLPQKNKQNRKHGCISQFELLWQISTGSNSRDLLPAVLESRRFKLLGTFLYLRLHLHMHVHTCTHTHIHNTCTHTPIHSLALLPAIMGDSRSKLFSFYYLLLFIFGHAIM